MKKYALKLADDSVAILKKDDDKYQFFSENYKFYFDRKTGFFARWGKTQDDDGDPCWHPQLLRDRLVRRKHDEGSGDEQSSRHSVGVVAGCDHVDRGADDASAAGLQPAG